MILITGGNGFVGRAIVHSLVDQKLKVRIMSRSASKSPHSPWFHEPLVEYCQGDVTRQADWQRALEGVQTVIHCAGIIAETQGRTYHSMHVESARHAVNACRDKKIRRIILISAIGARDKATTAYHQTKWEGEEIIRQSSLDWTIFRPSLIFGPGDQFANRIATMLTPPWIFLHLGMFPVFGEGKTTFQPIAVDELAQIVTASIPRSDAIAKTFDITGQPLTYIEILRSIAHAIGYPNPTTLMTNLPALVLTIPWAILFCNKPIFFKIPIPLATFIAFAIEKISSVAGIEPLLNRAQVQMLQEEHPGDSSIPYSWINQKPTPFAEGITTYLSPTRHQPLILRHNIKR